MVGHIENHSAKELTESIKNMWQRIGDIKEFMKTNIRNSSRPELVQERIDRIDTTNCPIDMINHTSMLIHMMAMYFDQLEEE
tara:strand:- start:120 stop:365 length:246 start_codon:yes stop_codon:yes gene_type:complete